MDQPLQHRLSNYVDLLLDAVFLVDAAGIINYVNRACERIFGYTQQEMIGQPMLDFIWPEDIPRTLEESRQIMAGVPRVGFENRYVHKNGHIVHIMWSARWSETDKLRIGVARDVTGQKMAESLQAATYAVSEAAHSAQDLDSLFPLIHAIIARCVPLAGLAVATCNQNHDGLVFPYQRSDEGNEPLIDESAARSLCESVLREGQPVQLTRGSLAAQSDPAVSDPEACAWLIVPLAAQGEMIGALILKARRGAGYSDKDRELLHFVSAQVATAIERGQLKANLLRAAQYDELTSLPNRRLFLDRLHTALARSARRNRRMALLFIDIDDFKRVNDTLGHAAGDSLLQFIAGSLERSVRKADTVARLGGDEFVIILEAIHGPQDAEAITEKVRSALREGTVINGQTLSIQASIGTAIYPDDGRDAESLLKHADGGMYREKSRTLP